MPNIIFVLLRRLRGPLITLITLYAISMLGFVLIPGEDHTGQIWHMDFFHAFYFVSFMGTTIGFGEIPYPFTGTQRMWTTITMYTTVVAWLYAIGTILTVFQDSAFRQLRTETIFLRSIRRIKEPFYLVCGYGDIGNLLVTSLSDTGIRSVVIDIDQARINALKLADYAIFIPGLRYDACVPEALIKAGLHHTHCHGVIALTNDDHTNLKIAITTKLLRPDLLTIARAETHEVQRNIDSFGTEHIINPFDVFAERLALAIDAPGHYLLNEWMTSVPHETLGEPLFPPKGTWILCGFGRFGKAIYHKLIQHDITVTVIEVLPQETGAPTDCIFGRGTEASTLLKASVEKAVGIVAGTSDDADNLSIIMTARQLNPKLFTVARQNQRDNESLFIAAKSDLTMKRGYIIAHNIFAILTTPLLANFLQLSRKHNNAWANQLVSRISGSIHNEAPHRWSIELRSACTPAISLALISDREVRISHLLHDPHNRRVRLTCIALLLKRGNDFTLLPDEHETLQKGDYLLFCGKPQDENDMLWSVRNHNIFNYIYTGEDRYHNPILQWLQKIK